MIQGWQNLKIEIMKNRVRDTEKNNLLELSEEYFTLANNTVFAAQDYSERKAQRLKALEAALILITFCITILLVHTATEALLIRRRNLELSKKAYIDSNTGLPNKGRCEQFLSEHGILDSGKEYACIMFDLNNLKVVNDSFGHKAGDALILNFANIIRQTASKNMFVGRYGGDEFITVLFDTNEEEVVNYLTSVEKNVQAFRDSENGTKISYAVGYELSNGYKDCTLSVLLGAADKKMYINKQLTKMKAQLEQ